MGNFYHNVTFKNVAPETIAASIRDAGLTAYISPRIDRSVVAFFPIEECDPGADPVPDVTRRCDCAALAVSVFDDDVILLTAYARGDLLFRLALPEELAEEFGDDVTAADLDCAAILCNLFNPSASPESVLDILKKEYLFQHERHGELCGQLGLPDIAVACGYEYIQGGELPPEIEPDELEHVP